MRTLAVFVGWTMLAAIVWLSLTPSPPSLDVTFGDKLGHLAAYGSLMFWFGQLYASRSARAAYALAFALMGVALEFAQATTGYRSFEVLDMAANAAGVALGWVAAAILPPLPFALPAARPSK